MKQTFTAVVKQEGNSWIGWIEEVPGVNCQEATREELLETLRITLAEAIEFNRREARDAAGKRYEELQIAFMKRQDLLAHLAAHGYIQLIEGARHSWWHNPAFSKRSAVPRHAEVDNHLARKICRDLGVPEPARF